MQKRIISFLLSILLVLGSITIPSAIRAEQNAAHLIINQVYGRSDKTEGAVSHCFIELYNPTDNDINLEGYSIQYAKSKTSWNKKDLTGTISKHTSFLIRGYTADNLGRYQIEDGKFDMEWADCKISNDCFKVALVSSQTIISVQDPTGNADIVDFVGCNSDDITKDTTDAYETLPAVGISKQKSARRINFADTDDNSQDLEILDYRASGINDNIVSEVKPRYSGDGEWYTPYTSIEISDTTKCVEIGESFTLAMDIAPANATYSTVTWKSSDESIATVSSAGTVQAVAIGEATITATTKAGIAKSCVVTVQPEASSGVESITLSENSKTLELNDSPFSLEATVLPLDADQTVTWESSNELVATVSEDGLVTPIRDGIATITAKAINGLAVTCEVTINPIHPEGIIINQVYGKSNKTDGSVSHSFIELYNPMDYDVDLSYYSLQYSVGGTSWSKLDLMGTIGSKESFLVRCYSKGAAGARFTIDNYDMDWSACEISNDVFKVALMSGHTQLTVVDPTSNEYLTDFIGAHNSDYVNGVDACEATPVIGTSKQKSARRIGFTDTDINSNDFEIIDYRAENGEVGISDTLLNEVKPRYSGDGKWYTAGVLEINATTKTMHVGETFAFTANVSPIDSTYKTMTWTTSDAQVVKFTTGTTVEAMAIGSATIQVRLTDGSVAQCLVTVTETITEETTKEETTKEETTKEETTKEETTTDKVPDVIKNGWVTENGKEYYYINGNIQKSVWVNGKYRTDANGTKIKSKFIKEGKVTYYMDKNGVKATGTKWLKVGKASYRIVKDKVQINKAVKIGKKLYIVDKTGKKVTTKKFYTIGKKTYFITGKKGTVKKNAWITYKKKVYRADKNGVIVKNKKVKIGKKMYTFNKKGVCTNKK